MRRCLLSLLVAISSAGAPARAVDPDAPDAAELGRILRALLVPNIPDPLIEQHFGWGHQELVPVGVKWEKKGILLKPQVMKKMHNQGHWRKITATVPNPDHNIQLRVDAVKTPERGRLDFALHLAMPVRIRFEQQLWKSGVRLYSGETRARCNVTLDLVCESTTRTEKKPGAWLPDVVFRLRVTQARLNYRDFVVEHTAGVGGDAAKLLGEAVHETIRQWKPALERDLLAKANAAIVKAADTKEIRLGLSRLLDSAK